MQIVGFTTGYYEVDVNDRHLYSFITMCLFCAVVSKSLNGTAHVIPKLFNAILVFSDRATIYSDVNSLTDDQLKTQHFPRETCGEGLEFSLVQSPHGCLYNTGVFQRDIPLSMIVDNTHSVDFI